MNQHKQQTNQDKAYEDSTVTPEYPCTAKSIRRFNGKIIGQSISRYFYRRL